MVYQLSRQSGIQLDPIRSICFLKASNKLVTGHSNGEVVVWDSETLTLEQRRKLHDGTVYCLLSDIRLGTTDRERLFFSAGQDKRIILSWKPSASNEGQEETSQRLYLGHTGPVCSLGLSYLKENENQKDVLCSGSWDATIRIWDIDTQNSLFVLRGCHTHAVTVFPFSLYGKDGSQTPYLASGSQDGSIHIWAHGINNFNEPVQSASRHHTDIIRGFCMVNNSDSNSSSNALLLSCSNDGSIRAFDMQQRGGLDYDLFASNTFIFDMVVLVISESEKKEIVATASEDGTVRLFDVTKRSQLQLLKHAATVWKIVPLENGDFATGGSEGLLRLWSEDPLRLAPSDEMARYEQSLVQKNNIISDIAENLPDEDDRDAYKENKVGKVKLFHRKDNNIAVAYSWNGHQWDYIGEVTGKADSSSLSNDTMMGTFYEGDGVFEKGFYDYIFNVDIEDNVPPKKLPYRVGENAYEVADKFCGREQLSRTLISQIEDFIKKNSVQLKTSDILSEKNNKDIVSRYFPLKEFFSFKLVSLDKVKKAILLNASTMSDCPNLKPTELELTYLNTLFEKLAVQPMASQSLRACELDIVFNGKLSLWPYNKLLPVMDLWRIIALHPQIADLHKGTDGGWKLIKTALLTSNDKSNTDEKLITCSLRYICNLFPHPTIVAVILKFLPQMMQMFPQLEDIPEGCSNAWLSVIANISIALLQNRNGDLITSSSISQDSLIQQIAKALDVSVQRHNLKAIFNLLVIIGTYSSAICPTQWNNDLILNGLKNQLTNLQDPHLDTDIRNCAKDAYNLLMQ